MNNYELLHYLLNFANLSPTALDAGDRSALSWAVLHNSTEIAELLVDKILEREKASELKRLLELKERKTGRCPLHWLMDPTMAGTFANEKLLTLFVEKTKKEGVLGWNMVKDSNGVTALDLVRNNVYYFGVLVDLVGAKICGKPGLPAAKLSPAPDVLTDEFDVAADATAYIEKKRAQ